MEISYNHDSLHRKLSFSDVKPGQFFKYKSEPRHNSKVSLYLKTSDLAILHVNPSDGLFSPTSAIITSDTQIEEIYEGKLILTLLSKAW